MEVNENKAYVEIAATAAKYIQDSVRKCLTDSAQKDFMLWILADHNPFKDDYLKMLGVASSIKLEIAMLNNIVDDSVTFQKLSPYLGFLNAYFAFETIQDNIAIGLAAWFPVNNPTRVLQYEIIKNFNPIMIKKLQGDVTPTEKLLAPYVTMAQEISAYERCLSPSKMYKFASEFEQYCNNPSLLFELEHCFYPILILNVATCLALQHSLHQNKMYSFLQETLIARYASVDKLLMSAKTATAMELADLGAKTILVLPTLVYCIGALDVVSPNPFLCKAIQDHSLMKSIYSCALLVRLLNDIGTNLLTLKETERNNFFKDLKLFAQRQKFNSLLEFLLAVSDSSELGTMMIRIRKDVKYGEFNVCIDNLTDINDFQQALNEFCEKIIFYSKLYQQYSTTLTETCDHLTKILGDTKISKFIFNMFKFHEKMYSLKFESRSGDYAVLGEEG